jgi:hypothetical protein
MGDHTRIPYCWCGQKNNDDNGQDGKDNSSEEIHSSGSTHVAPIDIN